MTWDVVSKLNVERFGIGCEYHHADFTYEEGKEPTFGSGHWADDESEIHTKLIFLGLQNPH